ncbi:MAG: hypothetical protein ASARMPRED_001856 [Alectoria sarmentosa]|nr:MAG: hypothetical protein ASARMPRED_001856 [Alectoria sarmentosa]
MSAANTKEAQPTASSQSNIDHQDVPGAERRKNNLRWHEVDNYAAAIRLNRSYLLGETWSTIYSCGLINAETLPLVEGLLRLHDFRILTFSGQPQLRETPELITVYGKSFWYGTKQRAYLDLLVPRLGEPILSASLQTFCHLLLHHPGVVTQIKDDIPGRTPYSPPAEVQDNFAEERYPLTLKRTAPTAEEPDEKEFDVFTGTPGWIKEAEWPEFGCDAIDRARPLEFTVAAR